MKKCITRSIWILTIILILLLVYLVLDFVSTDDVDSLERRTLYDFYTQESIDTLFVGTSHLMFGIDAPQLTKDLGVSVFNLSSADLDYVQMYYLLKEAFRVKQIQNVYIEISPSRFF